MQTRRVWATLACVALLFVSTLRSLAAQQDTARIPELVVTATKTETDRRAVAASVSSISGEELRARGFRFVLDWLRETPGAAVVQSGSFGGVTSLFLRGGESDYTKVLIDGVPANQPGGAFNFANLSTDLIERIEIVRGPSSVLYGSDAVSGVIQIVTRRESGASAIDLSARAGTFGTVDLQAEGAGTAGTVQWSGGAARFASDGIYPFNNQYRGQTASGRLGLTGDRADIALTGRFGDHDSHFPTDFAGVVSDSNQLGTERTLSLSLDGGYRGTAPVELRGLAALFTTEQGFEDRVDGPSDTTGFGYESARDGDVRRTLFDLRALFRPSNAVTLTLGGERVDERESLTNRTVSNFGSGSVTDLTEFEEERGNTAGYAQLLAAAGTRVDLQGGLRLDHNEVFGDFTTWRAGLVVRPASSLRLFGSGGTGFRQPTFSEQFARTAFEVGNPDLVPERSTSWEAGAEVTALSNRLTLTASYFAQRFRDLIQFRAAAPEQPTYANIAKARADGVETGARFWLGHGVTLSADYTWLDTEVEDDGGLGTTTYQVGESLLRRPPHSLGIGLGWRTSDHGWYNLRLLYTGDRDDVDFREFPAERVTLEGYTLLDATAEVPLSLLLGAGADPFRVTLWGQNLLDSDYESVVGYAGRGLTLLVGVSVRK